MEHYRCHQVYIYKIRSTRISDTVEFPPHKFPMPRISSADEAFQAAQDLIHVLENSAPAETYNAIGTEHTAELCCLVEIFLIIKHIPIPAPTPRVIQDAAPPRVNNENIASPRVTTTTTPSIISPMNQ